MIKIKISQLLSEHKMTQRELAQMTGIRPNTISMLYHETIKRLDIDMINTLCKTFNITNMNDLMEYLPDDNNFVFQFTPLRALENAVTTLLSNDNLSQNTINENQDFIYSLFMQVLSNPNLNNDSESDVILAKLFVDCAKNRLLSIEKLNCLMESMSKID